MKLYRVMISSVAVVAAESSREAHTIASTAAGRIVTDDISPDIVVEGEVTSAEGLDNGWDDSCTPYGEAGDQTIAQILCG